MYPCPGTVVIPVNVEVVGIVNTVVGTYNLPFSVVVHGI